MMIYLDDYTLADEVPAADAVEQQQPSTSVSRTPGWIPGTSPICFSVTPTRQM
jgi:hypothetical protein